MHHNGDRYTNVLILHWHVHHLSDSSPAGYVDDAQRNYHDEECIWVDVYLDIADIADDRHHHGDYRDEDDHRAVVVLLYYWMMTAASEPVLV
jgi:hypothetical protein